MRGVRIISTIYQLHPNFNGVGFIDPHFWDPYIHKRGMTQNNQILHGNHTTTTVTTTTTTVRQQQLLLLPSPLTPLLQTHL